MNVTITTQRRSLTARLFPEGPPSLWCPLITHYDDDGRIDAARTAAHLTHLAPYVKGLLVPGSTGDAWQMTEEQVRDVVTAALGPAGRLGQRVLVGVLKPDAEDTARFLRELAKWLSGASTGVAASRLAARNVCGFTICGPSGEELTPPEIGYGLTMSLESGLPLALYQLPQVTQNEMPPDMVQDLAMRFPNFIVFKDTSGEDSVAASRKKPAGIILLRGAEGDYARWYVGGGGPGCGPYHGFLLSTANCFARQLAELMEDLRSGRRADAETKSTRLTEVVADLFDIVKPLKDGNSFANANKAADHFFAFGSRATAVPPPRLHSGNRLPIDVIQAAGAALQQHGLMPTRGYLE
jgi:dihydrodipicolinate synthase/N-acetylneuraminate lyase